MKILSIAFIVILMFSTGCRNCKPIKMPLSDYSKTWVEYSGTAATFEKQDSEVALLNYSQPVDQFTVIDFRGEECGDLDNVESIDFDLSGTSIPHNFTFHLVAYYGHMDWLYVTADTYQLNLFLTFSNDIAALGHENSELVDQVILNGSIFHNVYHSFSDSLSTDSVTDIYFTKEHGIVGFKTIDGDTWSLK